MSNDVYALKYQLSPANALVPTVVRILVRFWRPWKDSECPLGLALDLGRFYALLKRRSSLCSLEASSLAAVTTEEISARSR